MIIQISKKVPRVIVVSILVSLLVGIGCSVLIHHLADILMAFKDELSLENDAETYMLIFGQLKEAKVDLPAILLVILCGLYVFRSGRLLVQTKDEIMLKRVRVMHVFEWILFSLILIPMIILITLWFTNVNGIRFSIVIKFLFNALQNSVF